MTHTSEPSLASLLRARGCLLDGEEAMLRSPDAAALDARAQLAWLTSNRRVGWFVTVVAGGLRLVVLAVAAIAIPLLGLRGDVTPWLPLGVSFALAAVVVWLTPQLVRRLRALGQPLPRWEEIASQLERR